MFWELKNGQLKIDTKLLCWMRFMSIEKDVIDVVLKGTVMQIM